MSRYGRFAPYVPVAQRREQAAQKIAKMRKKGEVVCPVVIEARTIAHTFWGKSWCKNLESYSDFESRLPRGRTYVRNGSVIDLQVSAGCVKAMVSGSSIYKITITIDPVSTSKWDIIVNECAGKIESVIELLQGKISKGIMEVITRQGAGLFPTPKEIKLDCSCPDYAVMCKHVAAVLYGIGARLDERPEDLFLLRQAKYDDLIVKVQETSFSDLTTDQNVPILSDDLGALFDIEFEAEKMTG